LTTILITPEYIAWESCLTFGGQRHINAEPKVVVNDFGLWAGAGAPDICDKAMRVLCSDEDVDLTEVPGFVEAAQRAGGFELARVWRDAYGDLAVQWWSDTNLYGFVPPLPLALGSGSSFVLGAYYASGRDVPLAIQLAAEHDEGSSGPVFVKSTNAMLDAVDHLKKRKYT